VIIQESVSRPCTSDPLPVQRPARFTGKGLGEVGAEGAVLGGAGEVGVDPHAEAIEAASVDARTSRITFTTAEVYGGEISKSAAPLRNGSLFSSTCWT
jgi:hypothetical protein